jgi:O-antigen ligase
MELVQRLISGDLKERVSLFGFVLSALLFGWLLVRFQPDMALGLGIFLTLVTIFIADIRLGMTVLVFAAPLLPLTQGFTTLFPGTSYSVNLCGLVNVFIPLLGLLYLGLRRGTSRSLFLGRPIALFLGVALLTFFVSDDRWITLREWFRLAMPIMFYLLILSSFRTREELQKLRKALIFSAFIPLALGLYQILNGEPDAIGFNRVYGTFAHPNGFACYLVVLMPLVALSYIRSWKVDQKVLYLGTFGLMFLSLIFTFTRVAWIAFVVSMMILGWSKYRRFFFRLALVFLILVLLLPSLGHMVTRRIQPDGSFYGRFSFNQFSLFIFSQKPILGHGFGTYTALSTSAFGEKGERYGRVVGVAAHNDYLRTLAETGVVGLVSLLILFLAVFRMGRRLRRSGDGELKLEALMLLAVLVSILVYGITDSGLSYAGIFLWTLIALVEKKAILSDEELKSLSNA